MKSRLANKFDKTPSQVEIFGSVAMNSRICLALLFLGFVIACSSTPGKTKLTRKQLLIHGRPWLRPRPNVEKLYKAASPDQYIASKVDHFDSNNTKTYQQRYWYNDQWYQQGGPVFLMLGGESRGNPELLETDQLFWTGLARDNNAFTFLLEHRYYGASQVADDQSTGNLKYLSSRQALADIADFIPAMNAKFNLTGPWITFGGSYPGALVAWSRMLYPNLIYGAVGSSGIVQAVVDFTGFLGVVTNDLNAYSPECGNSLQNALAQVRQLVTTSSGRQQLFKGFRLCQPLDPNNQDQIAYFYLNIIQNYMIVAQYSKDNQPPFDYQVTIDALCQIQTQPGRTDLDNMYAVNSWVMGFLMESCVNNDYNDHINFLKQAGDDRCWFYQTCTEFGFYHTTDSPNNAFYGDVIPINWYIKQCAQIFENQFDNSSVYTAVDNTNRFYKGQKGYNATRVILPNGTHDPWHVLGVSTAPNSEAYPIIINGTSHMADMYGDNPDIDPPQLTAARQQIRGHVNSWLKAIKK